MRQSHIYFFVQVIMQKRIIYIKLIEIPVFGNSYDNEQAYDSHLGKRWVSIMVVDPLYLCIFLSNRMCLMTFNVSICIKFQFIHPFCSLYVSSLKGRLIIDQVSLALRASISTFMTFLHSGIWSASSYDHRSMCDEMEVISRSCFWVIEL